jgi:hypothetical protein
VQKKALVVEFKNAAVFRNRKPSNDKLLVGKKRIPRRDAPMIEVPDGALDVRHVANMLHVLMGERPVSSFRPTAASSDPDIEKAAHDAKFRMDEVTTLETKACRKSVDDAWQTETTAYTLNGKSVAVKGGHLYARRLKRFLGDALYAEFLSLAATLCTENGITGKLTTQQLVELLNAHGKDKRVAAFTKACRAANRTDLANIIEPGGKSESISMHTGRGTKLNILMVGAGPEKVSRYSGTIYIPLTSERLMERVANGCGVATFLEGGMASIAGVEEWSTDLVHGAKPVTLNKIKGHVPVSAS